MKYRHYFRKLILVSLVFPRARQLIEKIQTGRSGSQILICAIDLQIFLSTRINKKNIDLNFTILNAKRNEGGKNTM